MGGRGECSPGYPRSEAVGSKEGKDMLRTELTCTRSAAPCLEEGSGRVAACWGWDSPVPWVAENGQHEKPRGSTGGEWREGGRREGAAVGLAGREGAAGIGSNRGRREEGRRKEGPPRSGGEKTTREALAARGENLKRNNKTKHEIKRKNGAEERAGESEETVRQRPLRATPSHAALRGGGTAGFGPLSNGGGDAGPPLTTPTTPRRGRGNKQSQLSAPRRQPAKAAELHRSLHPKAALANQSSTHPPTQHHARSAHRGHFLPPPPPHHLLLTCPRNAGHLFPFFFPFLPLPPSPLHHFGDGLF